MTVILNFMQFKTLKRLTWLAVIVFLLWAGGISYLVASHRLDSPAQAIKQPLRGTITRKEYIPAYWFTHVVADNNGVRSLKDFQPDQWLITVTLTTGTPYRFYTDQAGYDTLKLNKQWQSKPVN